MLTSDALEDRENKMEKQIELQQKAIELLTHDERAKVEEINSLLKKRQELHLEKKQKMDRLKEMNED